MLRREPAQRFGLQRCLRRPMADSWRSWYANRGTAFLFTSCSMGQTMGRGKRVKAARILAWETKTTSACCAGSACHAHYRQNRISNYVVGYLPGRRRAPGKPSGSPAPTKADLHGGSCKQHHGQKRALRIVKGIMRTNRQHRWTIALLLCVGLLIAAPAAGAKPKKLSSEQLRKEYMARVQEQASVTPMVGSLGSLYSPNAAFIDISSDYKARRVGDVVTLVVYENTTAQSTGDLNTSRSYQTSSAITGLPGGTSTSLVNPLFGANSSTQLKGTGETSAGSM